VTHRTARARMRTENRSLVQAAQARTRHRSCSVEGSAGRLREGGAGRPYRQSRAGLGPVGTTSILGVVGVSVNSKLNS
jgi:hypothetical protein